LVLASILSTLIGLGLITHVFRFPLNHDVGWYLHVASRMLNGEAIYSSIIEVNPPLYAYLMIIPIALAAMVDMAVPNAAIVLLVGICVASIALSTWLAMVATRARLAGPILGVIAGAALLGLPGVDLGQREHVMFALIMPFLLLYACRILERQVSLRMAVLVGLAAGLGLALKPHFVLTWLCFEAVLGLIRADPGSRMRRPEVRCVTLVLATYACFVVVFHHQYFTLMWRARNLYSAFAAAELADMLFNTHGILVATVLVSYAVVRDDRIGLRQATLPFVSFAAVSWLVAIIQGKGWSYHFFPAAAAATIAGLLLALAFIADLRHRRLPHPPVTKLLAIVALIAVLWMSGAAATRVHLSEAGRRWSAITEGIGLLAGLQADSFVLLSPNVSDAFPLVNYADVEWASPFATIWWLQSAYGPGDERTAGTQPLPMDRTERTFRDLLVERMIQIRPDVVLVDKAPSTRFGGRTFPYIAYLSRDPRFVSLWDDYSLAARSGRYAVYALSRGRDWMTPPAPRPDQ
jgi:hypothetical protein